MLNQPGYNFKPLLDLIIQTSSADITAALHHTLNPESNLYKAFQKFRADFTPGKMTVGMHFNYRDLQNAYVAFDQEWDKLHDGGNCDKNILFCRQVIGFIQRSLPAVDRQVYALSLNDVVEREYENPRSFNFKYGGQGLDFPVTAGDVSFSGLGFDYYAGGVGPERGYASLVGWNFERLMSSKNSRLAELMPPHREEKKSRCVIC